MYNFDDAVAQLMYYENKKINPAPWHADLTIGPIHISTTSYKKISDEKSLPPWKLRASLPNTTCERQIQYFKQSEEGTTVDPKELIQGYQYGSTLVPFTDADQTLNYASGDRCLMLIGFTKLANISRDWFLGKGVHYVVARKDAKSSERAFNAMIDVMSAKKVAGIARRVYNKNNAPHINALIPKITKKYKCLVMIELPFFEDMHLLAFPPLLGKKCEPNQEQIDAMDNFIDSMDLMTGDETEDGELIEAYQLKRTMNPQTQHIYQSLAYRAMYTNLELLPPKQEVLDMMSVPKVLQERVQPLLKKLSQLFPITEKIEVLTNREKWINKQLATVGAKQEEPQIDEQADPNIEINTNIVTLTKSVLVEVGTLNPAKDFEQLLARGENFVTVAKQIQKVITNLVLKSFDEEYVKPLLALETFRIKSVITDPAVYNDWMLEFKDLLMKINKIKFWEKIVEGQLGLITTTENITSGITDSRADAFVRQEESASLEMELEQEIDVDDLFDEM